MPVIYIYMRIYLYNSRGDDDDDQPKESPSAFLDR
jgi:hypothetical protein